MNSDRWQQVKEVLDAALKRPPNERVRFLDEACKNDGELRSEVESFLLSKPLPRLTRHSFFQTTARTLEQRSVRFMRLPEKKLKPTR